MSNDGERSGVRAGRASSGLQQAIRQLPEGGLERQAIEAGEIDAVIDYGSANVIVFPAARRALRDVAARTSAASRDAALAMGEGNSVLAALPRSEYRRLLLGLERVMLDFGDVLHEPGAPIRHVYFPVDCVICLLTVTDGQRVVATGLVGHEGMLGMAVACGVDRSSVRAQVQVAGAALRMPVVRFRRELQRGQQLQRQLYRYAQVKLDQARQIAACMSSHCFEQRLACALLMLVDRARSQELLLTQEHMAAVLNVRRVSVTLACSTLRSRGLIRYSRGKIKILDRSGLESASCACYRPLAVAPAGAAGAVGAGAAGTSG